MDEGIKARKAIETLRSYLRKNLTVDKDFVTRLKNDKRKLLDKISADQFVALADKGKGIRCLDGLLEFMSSYYVDQTLEDFCDFLEEYSKEARHRLHPIALRIREEMGISKHQAGLAKQQDRQDGVPGPSRVGRSARNVASESSVSTPVQQSSQASQPMFVPVISELKAPFSKLTTKILSTISSLNGEDFEALCTNLLDFLYPDVPRMTTAPSIPRTFDQLKPFLVARWDPLQIHVLQTIVHWLDKEDLNSQLEAYEEKLKSVPEFLSECKAESVPHKKLPQHTSVAVTVSLTAQKITLHHILELKNFFIESLGLCDTIFKGYSKDRNLTVLHFSIPEGSLWCLPTCLQPSNLPQLEEWKTASLSVEGTFTVDIVKRRVVTLDKYVVMNKLLETPAEIMSMKLENAKLSSRIAILQDEMTDKTELSSLKEKMTTLEKAVNFQMEVLVDKEKSISGLSSPVAVQKRTLSKSCKNLKGRGKKLLASHGVFSTHSASSSLVTQGPTHRQMVQDTPPGCHRVLKGKSKKLLKSHDVHLTHSAPSLLMTHSPTYHRMVLDTPPGQHRVFKGKRKKSRTSHDVYLSHSAPSSLMTQGPAYHTMIQDTPPGWHGVVKGKGRKLLTSLDVLSPHSAPSSLVEKVSSTRYMGPQPMCSTPLQTGATELLNPTRTAEVSPTIQSLRESEENLRKLIWTEEEKLVTSIIQEDTAVPLVLQNTIENLKKEEENIHNLRLFEEAKLKLRHLHVRVEPDALEGMWSPTAVYVNGKIFVSERRFYRQFLHVFNIVKRMWCKIPLHDHCEMLGFTLATTANQVHAIGGRLKKDSKEEEYSNIVFSLDDNLKWSKKLPPLNIGRVYATSTSFEDMIVVAGGKIKNGSALSSVEVLDSSLPSFTWWEICDLPVKSWFMQCIATDNELFIGCGEGGASAILYIAKLSAVKKSLIPSDRRPDSSVSPEPIWESLPKTPHVLSGLGAVNGCIITLGGCSEYDQLKHNPSIYFYDCYRKTWTKVSNILKSRCSPAVVACTAEGKQELFVLGGLGAATSVESCEL